MHSESGQGIGARLPRKEDDRYMRGRGQYVGDIRLDGQLEVAFLRSPVAHARITSVKVPDDISMIGYDDVEMARFSSPPLTTIRHPKAELGLLAVQQLVSRIRNKELEVESMTVQPELIVRRSVKSLR